MVKDKVRKAAKKFAGIFASVVLIILVFSFIDYLVHSLNESEWGVPSYYFTNKIIYGILWGLAVCLIMGKWEMKPVKASLIFSAAVSIILQARYAYEGYPMNFVLIFLVLHFLMLFAVSYFVFKLIKVR